MSIPDEMIVEISKYADGSTLFNLLLINESINFLISSDQCWYERIILAFPGAKNAMSELMKFMSLPHIYLSHLRYEFSWINNQYIPCYTSSLNILSPNYMASLPQITLDCKFLEYDDVDIFKYHVDKINIINNKDVTVNYFVPVLTRGCKQIIFYLHGLNLPLFKDLMQSMVGQMITRGLSAKDNYVILVNIIIKTLDIILLLYPNILREEKYINSVEFILSENNNKSFVEWLNTKCSGFMRKM